MRRKKKATKKVTLEQNKNSNLPIKGYAVFYRDQIVKDSETGDLDIVTNKNRFNPGHVSLPWSIKEVEIRVKEHKYENGKCADNDRF